MDCRGLEKKKKVSLSDGELEARSGGPAHFQTDVVQKGKFCATERVFPFPTAEKV